MQMTYLTPGMVARRLKLSTSRVIALDREGRLPAFRDPAGRRWYDPDVVERFARQRAELANVRTLRVDVSGERSVASVEVRQTNDGSFVARQVHPTRSEWKAFESFLALTSYVRTVLAAESCAATEEVAEVTS